MCCATATEVASAPGPALASLRGDITDRTFDLSRVAEGVGDQHQARHHRFGVFLLAMICPAARLPPVVCWDGQQAHCLLRGRTDESGRPLVPSGTDALFGIGPGKTEELQRERGIESGARQP